MTIKIVTTDGKLSDVKLPIPITELEFTANSAGVSALSKEQEYLIADWVINNTVSGIECEISEDRLQAIKTGSRSTMTEDHFLCKYILRVWREIESIRKVM